MAKYSTVVTESGPQLTRIVQNPVVNEALALTAKDRRTDNAEDEKPIKKGPSMREQLGLTDTQTDRIELQHSKVIFRSDSLNMCAPATKQILAYTLIGLSENLPSGGLTEEEAYKHVVYYLDLNQYCQARGIKDKKSAKQSLVKALKDLTALTFEYSYTHYERGGNGRNYPREVTAEGGILTLIKPLKSQKEGYFYKGKCKIVFSGPFIEFMANSGRYYMPFYKPLLEVNPHQNPYSFQLGYKLQTHRFMNEGKPGQGLISVKALVSVCDFNTDTHRVSEQIIDPFERDLDRLQSLGILNSWEYTNAKGEKLRDDQLKFSNLSTWLKLYIKFEFKNYPALAVCKKPIRKGLKAKK